MPGPMEAPVGSHKQGRRVRVEKPAMRRVDELWRGTSEGAAVWIRRCRACIFDQLDVGPRDPAILGHQEVGRRSGGAGAHAPYPARGGRGKEWKALCTAVADGPLRVRGDECPTS